MLEGKEGGLGGSAPSDVGLQVEKRQHYSTSFWAVEVQPVRKSLKIKTGIPENATVSEDRTMQVISNYIKLYIYKTRQKQKKTSTTWTLNPLWELFHGLQRPCAQDLELRLLLAPSAPGDNDFEGVDSHFPCGFPLFSVPFGPQTPRFLSTSIDFCFNVPGGGASKAGTALPGPHKSSACSSKSCARALELEKLAQRPFAQCRSPAAAVARRALLQRSKGAQAGYSPESELWSEPRKATSRSSSHIKLETRHLFLSIVYNIYTL